MSLKGGPQLRARLRAIKQVFKPVGRHWADDTVALARQRVKVRTGKTQRSIRVRNATQRKAVVVATHGARFLEAGTAAHTEKARRAKTLRFQDGGRTIFSRKVNHPRTTAHPFLRNSAREALAKNPMAEELINLWNAAA